MVTATEVDSPPGPGWNARGAMSFPETWAFIRMWRPADFPMSISTFVSIFFEETACCNMLQQQTPAAIGPGQLQVSEDGKVDFFACQDPAKDNFMGGRWDSSMTISAVNQLTGQTYKRQARAHPALVELTSKYILDWNEFSVKMHVKFMQWLGMGFGSDGKTKSLDGLLAAQTGGGKNVAARQAFKNGAIEIDKLMQPDPRVNSGWTKDEWGKYLEMRREEWRNALNVSRAQFKGNTVPRNRVKFWQYFLPDEFLKDQIGYMELGYYLKV